MESANFFQEDDQAPLLEIILKQCPWLFEHKPGQVTMSHSFEIIDLSEKEEGKVRKM